MDERGMRLAMMPTYKLTISITLGHCGLVDNTRYLLWPEIGDIYRDNSMYPNIGHLDPY